MGNAPGIGLLPVDADHARLVQAGYADVDDDGVVCTGIGLAGGVLPVADGDGQRLAGWGFAVQAGRHGNLPGGVDGEGVGAGESAGQGGAVGGGIGVGDFPATRETANISEIPDGARLCQAFIAGSPP